MAKIVTVKLNSLAEVSEVQSRLRRGGFRQKREFHRNLELVQQTIYKYKYKVTTNTGSHTYSGQFSAYVYGYPVENTRVSTITQYASSEYAGVPYVSLEEKLGGEQTKLGV